MDDIRNIYSTPFDNPPIPRFPPVRGVVEGFYWRVSFVLPFGEVIHDYLAPRKAPDA